MITLQSMPVRFGSMTAGNPNLYRALLDNVHPAITSGGLNNPYLESYTIGLWVRTREELPAVIQALKQVKGFGEYTVEQARKLGSFAPDPSSAYKYSYNGRPVAFCVDRNEPEEV